jgi:hypothetical protein
VLLAAIREGDTSALGQFYDRYGPALYTLARHRHLSSADLIVEQVFIDLWNAGQRTLLPVPIVPMLLDLAARSLSGTAVSPGLFKREGAPQDPLALLTHIGGSDPLVCAVLVLVRLGRLNIAESVAPLEAEPAVIRHALVLGLKLLCQHQPVTTAEASLVLQQPTSSGVLSGIQAQPEAGVQ